MMKKTIYLAGALGAALGTQALASSHREAPLIAEDPAADSTDLYVFRSPSSDGSALANSVTIIANYWPFEEPGGGPNWPRFSDQVLYEIKIDNDGDAKEDITFQFRFRTEYRRPLSFLFAGNQVTTNVDSNLQVTQRYTVTRIDRSGQKVLLQDQLTPPVYAGDFTMPSYATLANTAIYELGGNANVFGRVFAGQRDDPFFADLGAVFDLVRTRCQADPNSAVGCGASGAGPKKGVDYVGGYNVHTIALQLPIHQVTSDGDNGPTGKKAIIGVWTTASRPRVTIRRAPGNAAALGGVRVQDQFGPWVQVSRLGLPLVNEMLLPVALKDFFNTTPPSNDAALFTSQPGMPVLTNPELAGALKALYGLDVPNAGRTDLLELVQFHIATSEGGSPIGPFKGKIYSLAPADILRVDLSVAPPQNLSDNRLGAIGVLNGIADSNIGFPNGRRLHDDVVDIMERVVAGSLRGKRHALTDGVDRNDRPFLDRFPYVAHPWSGSSVGTGANSRLHQADQGTPQ